MYLTYAMVTSVPVDFCTHAICVVIDNFHEKVTSLPFGALITRIATHLRSFYSFFHTPKVFSVVVPLFRSPLPKSLRNIHGLLIGQLRTCLEEILRVVTLLVLRHLDPRFLYLH
jgi:hypothetical protein